MAYMAETAPGPGFFPLWVGLGLMLLSGILFLRAHPSPAPFIENRSGFRKAMVVAAAFLVYVLTLGYLGSLVGLALFLAFLVGWVERRGWRAWIGTAFVGSLSCYLLFEVWLRVPLPRGLLGI